MADETKRAQRVWAGLGGLGPVPKVLVSAQYQVAADSLADEFEHAVGVAKQVIAERRHDLRMRLIEAALPACVAEALYLARTDSLDNQFAAWASDRAINAADHVLARLEAEAKAGVA